MTESVESSSSLPDLPSDHSHGSSVSSSFVNEYDELLKYAIVAPRVTVEPNLYARKDMAKVVDLEEGSSVKEVNFEEMDISFKVNPNYKTELKILEAKKAIEESLKQPEAKKFDLPNTLDSLLEFSRTPVKESTQLEHCEHTVPSNSSTPESGVCSPLSYDKVDQGVLRMDRLIDEWSSQLKRNLLVEMVDMKGELLQHQEAVLTELKSQHNNDMQKLQREIDSLKEMLCSFEQNVKQKDEMIASLTEALNKQKEKSDKIRMFSLWKLKLNDERRQDFASKMAEKFYKKSICSKVLLGWRNVVESKWKLRVEKACQIRSQDVCLKLTEDYEERLQALQKELAKEHSAVAQMHRERDLYEENMKKTFMRGVCALNMEAMSMFKENCPPDDGVTGHVDNHHSCEVPSPPLHESKVENARLNYAVPTRKEETEIDNRAENPRKHVTFNPKPQYEDSIHTSARNTLRNHNKKNLHVKMSAKKQNSSSAKKDKSFGTSRTSTISSIKVERHIPLETTQQKSFSQGPLKASFRNEEASDARLGTRPLPETIKVVD